MAHVIKRVLGRCAGALPTEGSNAPFVMVAPRWTCGLPAWCAGPPRSHGVPLPCQGVGAAWGRRGSWIGWRASLGSRAPRLDTRAPVGCALLEPVFSCSNPGLPAPPPGPSLATAFPQNVPTPQAHGPLHAVAGGVGRALHPRPCPRHAVLPPAHEETFKGGGKRSLLLSSRPPGACPARTCGGAAPRGRGPLAAGGLAGPFPLWSEGWAGGGMGHPVQGFPSGHVLPFYLQHTKDFYPCGMPTPACPRTHNPRIPTHCTGRIPGPFRPCPPPLPRAFPSSTPHTASLESNSQHSSHSQANTS